MQKFADKALIIFPKPENFENRPEHYRVRIERSLKNILKVLKEAGITPMSFTSDEVSLVLGSDDIVWINTLSRGDTFFMQGHNENMKRIEYKTNKVTDAELLRKAVSKYEMGKNLTVDQRFEVVIKRESLVSRALIKQFNLIIVFKQRNRSLYRVVSKPDDGKLLVEIDNDTFIPTCMISGREVASDDIFEIPGTNRSVCDWEV